MLITKVLGIPSGSLLKPTLALLRKAGMEVIFNGQSFKATIIGSDMFSTAIIMRPNDLPLALKSGVVDAIITGYDMLVESGLDKNLIVIQKLNYAKKSKMPARIVLFGRQEDSDEIIDTENILVSSEYIFLASLIFKKAKITFSTGSTEIKVRMKELGFEYGIGVTETGESINCNGLKIIKTILVSPVVFVTRDKSVDMEVFAETLNGSLSAELLQLVKFNAGPADLDALVNAIPSLESPTLNRLADGDIAIETVVSKNIIADTIIAIKKLGGRKIIIQDIKISV